MRSGRPRSRKRRVMRWVVVSMSGTIVIVIALAAIGILSTGAAVALSGYCTVTAPDPGGSLSTRNGLNLDPAQSDAARTIVGVATQRGLPRRAAEIALMTALQESDLHNLPPGQGTLDSVGLFQQRPSQGWGTPAQLNDPMYAAYVFYFGVSSAGIPGLTEIPGWDAMPRGQAAQAVQISAYPDAYTKWEPYAIALADLIYGQTAQSTTTPPASATCTQASNPGGAAGAQLAISRAMSQLGVPYSWGGGSPAGPTVGGCDDINGYLNGVCDASKTAGFDCSSLLQYAWWPVVQLPRVATDQYNALPHIPLDQLQPGDIIFYEDPKRPGYMYHEAMIVAPGQLVEAPHTGLTVRVRSFSDIAKEDHIATLAGRPSLLAKPSATSTP